MPVLPTGLQLICESVYKAECVMRTPPLPHLNHAIYPYHNSLRASVNNGLGVHRTVLTIQAKPASITTGADSKCANALELSTLKASVLWAWFIPYADKAQEEASRDAKVFNCAQRERERAISSWVEGRFLSTNTNFSKVLIKILSKSYLLSTQRMQTYRPMTRACGIEYPILSAVSCAVWTLSRISYTRGYITGDPEKRITPLYILGTVTLYGEWQSLNLQISSVMTFGPGQLLVASFTAGGWLYADFVARQPFITSDSVGSK
ncbi:LOW QUALITY PROTEIN: hypothetical protein CVT26_002073 [Gymnopilus dilepis]|uniref:Uncharacterized protein n=1 Tax=Gymnopilus dilepis TaxID=231916 RepID=A0A409VBX4_9AGAR|nr:LOW QUALITY PROTEIN: hypothetical protein CVT26_002073 [Gymnopilus dilepis]